MKRKEVLVGARRICEYSGLLWLYWKCFLEGRPPARPPGDKTHYIPGCDILFDVHTLTQPDPLVLKLEAFISKMKQKKDKEDV